MQVVDVDSHFFEPFTWLQQTDRRLGEELLGALPQVSFADFVFGEIVSSLPPEQQEEFARIMPLDFLGGGRGGITPEEAEARLEGHLFEKVIRSKGASDAAERVVACDEQGIDVQLVHPTFAMLEFHRVYRHQRARLPEVCRAYNDWALAHVDGHTDRLLPVALVDIGHVDHALSELRRMREAGSRGFLFQLYPVDGKPLSHPDHEPIWAAAADLGMMAIVHVGAGHIRFDPAWMATDRPGQAAIAFRMSGALAPSVAQLAISDLLFSGVFERHPKLMVVCSEFGISWVRGWWERIGPTTHRVTAQTLLPWDLPKPAHEYVRRNVRFSPLPGDPVDRFVEDFGSEMLWFASDYPHPEGSATAVAEFDEQLVAAPAAAREEFFGGGAAEYLRRTA